MPDRINIGPVIDLFLGGLAFIVVAYLGGSTAEAVLAGIVAALLLEVVTLRVRIQRLTRDLNGDERTV